MRRVNKFKEPLEYYDGDFEKRNEDAIRLAKRDMATFCSCYICRNLRHDEGPTLKERVFEENAKDQLKDLENKINEKRWHRSEIDYLPNFGEYMELFGDEMEDSL